MHRRPGLLARLAKQTQHCGLGLCELGGPCAEHGHRCRLCPQVPRCGPCCCRRGLPSATLQPRDWCTVSRGLGPPCGRGPTGAGPFPLLCPNGGHRSNTTVYGEHCPVKLQRLPRRAASIHIKGHKWKRVTTVLGMSLVSWLSGSVTVFSWFAIEVAGGALVEGARLPVPLSAPAAGGVPGRTFGGSSVTSTSLTLPSGQDTRPGKNTLSLPENPASRLPERMDHEIPFCKVETAAQEHMHKVRTPALTLVTTDANWKQEALPRPPVAELAEAPVGMGVLESSWALPVLIWSRGGYGLDRDPPPRPAQADELPNLLLLLAENKPVTPYPERGPGNPCVSSDHLVNLGCAHRGISPHSRASCPPCPVTVCLTYRRKVAGASSHLGLPVGGKGALEGPHIIVPTPSLVPPTWTHPDPEQLPHCQPPGGRSQPPDTLLFHAH
ncbi:hypothetical protein H8959_006827 [Pygathrix nigripes]